MKKAQGLSLTTIIVAAIAIIVLVVLIAIFTGKINIFGDEYSDTTEEATSDVCSPDGIWFIDIELAIQNVGGYWKRMPAICRKLVSFRYFGSETKFSH